MANIRMVLVEVDVADAETAANIIRLAMLGAAEELIQPAAKPSPEKDEPDAPAPTKPAATEPSPAKRAYTKKKATAEKVVPVAPQKLSDNQLQTLDALAHCPSTTSEVHAKLVSIGKKASSGAVYQMLTVLRNELELVTSATADDGTVRWSLTPKGVLARG